MWSLCPSHSLVPCFTKATLWLGTQLSLSRLLVHTPEDTREGTVEMTDTAGRQGGCWTKSLGNEAGRPQGCSAGVLRGPEGDKGPSARPPGKMELKDLTLRIPDGMKVALVGPSGGGKTTLCHLIPRFYDLESGSISINGRDIETITRRSLRQHIGIVQQDVFLFTGTIADNIGYAAPDATREQIREAARKARIDSFVESLPDSYDTYIGERGVMLSGGQKQRIAIARIFLMDPQILILDEATSALDNVTEAELQQSLDELSHGRTTIVVAHRLSTVRDADKIIFLTANGVEEQGTHDELLRLNGKYAALYNSQFA